MKQNNQDAPSGVLVVDKAPDMTSHDVVAIARGALGIRKIGHCGTLDPMATGVLMLVVNRATKLQDYLMAEDKEYVGEMTLGVTTDSQDADGEEVSRQEIPSYPESEIKQAFDKYQGEFEQLPPMVSAVKKDGQRLYKLARKGQVVERDPRPVRVDSYRIDQINLPKIQFTIHCSKGFYVRTYAHDIGQVLGCGAHLSALRRTRSGKFNLERAVTIDQLKNSPRQDLFNSFYTIAEISLMRG